MKYNFNTLLLIGSLCPLTAMASWNSCGLANGINIQTHSHELLICENQKPVQHFKISLGQNGVGKHNSGDKKTPLGMYSLGMPHHSAKFDTFIPINYPTHQQKISGFSGRDVGIHGPIQSLTWLGRMNTSLDWTFGCVAVNGNQEIHTIAEWIRHHPRTQVLIS